MRAACAGIAMRVARSLPAESAPKKASERNGPRQGRRRVARGRPFLPREPLAGARGAWPAIVASRYFDARRGGVSTVGSAFGNACGQSRL
ncbi:hypothetical protein AQ870_06475 [Burkholderia pseudomallei]|nr:hypothetical protein AQ870_06475 [Burkholderia pseudomallei]OND39131.1 hypothetical protein AQ931_26170 [Burkholderia pseudomallei]